jgi:hypothetical protein
MAQYGPHRWSAGDGGGDIDHTDAFRGARFTVADLTGATFRDCDLSRVRIIDSWLVDVNLSGYLKNCLSVVMEEECEHHRYMVRDLAVLESHGKPSG